jgi:hypothetical protein
MKTKISPKMMYAHHFPRHNTPHDISAFFHLFFSLSPPPVIYDWTGNHRDENDHPTAELQLDRSTYIIVSDMGIQTTTADNDDALMLKHLNRILNASSLFLSALSLIFFFLFFS